MPREEFDHFFLTRFNVRRDIHSKPASEEWLRQRLGIFREWCLPSVHSQTVAPDAWLIFCDSASPEWFREELDALLGGSGEVIWVNGAVSAEMFVEAVVDRMGAKPHLITTRVDNDDAISRDFVEMVQGCFEQQDKEFINFTCGAQYCGGRFYARFDPSNAFISLIERRSDDLPMTVHVDWHDRLDAYAPVRRVRSHYAWLQNVHGGNIANVARGIPIRPEGVLRHFSISVPILEISFLTFLWTKLAASSALVMRVASSPRRIKWLLKSLWSRSVRG